MTTTNQCNATNTASSVGGNFFETNANALAAALVLEDTTTVINTLTESKVNLLTADNGQDGNPGTATTKDVFFAFSGKPDDGRGATLDTFKKVGVITVTVTPII